MADTPRTVLVTGASTGIGRATALRLEREGWRVFAGVRKKADADSLEKEATAGRLTPVTLDVTKPRSIAAAKTKVQRAVGKQGLDGLVNNAGIANAGPVEHLPVEEFARVIEVNLTGQYAVTQAFLPLVRRATGTVAFISSIGGKIASPFMSPYNASKFGLEGMADSLRREVRPWGIQVVVIEPGSIATPIWEKGAEANESIDFGREGKRLYGAQMEAMREAILETGERGMDPDKAARAIQRALETRKPRTRYIVGRDAKMMRQISGLVGDRNFDWLMRRALRLPDEAPPPR